jgi:indolepyruvate ferredoxin oxidoreductase beta subunit
MRRKNTNILICGVGGQGVVLASALLADLALRKGYDVKQGVVKGMAQRGGSVVSNLRFGEKVYSPVIPKGEVDFLFSTEKLETLRWIEWCSPKTIIIADTLEIYPPAVNRGEMEYPKDIEEFLKSNLEKVYLLPATEIAKNLGDPRIANVVLLGALSNFLDFEESLWEETIMENVPKRFLEINLMAFREGKKLI